MTLLKRIFGLLLLALAFLFALGVWAELHSGDLHKQTRSHALGYGLIFVCVVSGLLLIFSGVLRAAGSDTGPKAARLRKGARPLSVSLIGILLIALVCLVSFRSVALLAGKQIVTGQVVAVDQPAILPSGRATYHVDYKYIDSAGATHSGHDAVSSKVPIAVKDPIEIAFSPYAPNLARPASHAVWWTAVPLVLGVFYQFWAVALYLIRKKLAANGGSPDSSTSPPDYARAR